jgi:hypothetical protein
MVYLLSKSAFEECLPDRASHADGSDRGRLGRHGRDGKARHEDVDKSQDKDIHAVLKCLGIDAFGLVGEAGGVLAEDNGQERKGGAGRNGESHGADVQDDIESIAEAEDALELSSTLSARTGTTRSVRLGGKEKG